MTSMKLEINDIQKADIFTQMFQNVKLFSTSVCLTFEKERLYVQGMDNNHVSIFEINLVKEWFDNYEISNPTTIGISTTIFHKILNTRNADHKIILALEESNNDKLSIDFTCDTKGEFSKEFHMPLMDIDSEHMGIPETEYDLEFTISSKKMKSIIDELTHFGDTIKISYDNKNDNVHFEADTEAEGSMKLNASINDFDSCTVDDEAVIMSSYASRFIQFMTHFHKLNKTCTLFIQSGIPMQFKYPLDTLENNEEEIELEKQNYVRFFLAPKIDDQEEQS